jgi:hypothetical protein
MGLEDGLRSAFRRLAGLSRDVVDRSMTAPAPSPPAQAPSTPAAALPASPLLSDSRIPPKCRAKAQQIVDAIARVQARAPSGALGSDFINELDRIGRIDLPELLDRYVNIPEEHRAEIFRRTQKSASFHLGESLGVIEARVTEVSRQLSQASLDGFTDATRFVDTRYGVREDPFA